jgi:hypothetical protein
MDALRHELYSDLTVTTSQDIPEYTSNDPLEARLERIREAQLHFAQLPVPEGMSMDDWMYDDYGLPR